MRVQVCGIVSYLLLVVRALGQSSVIAGAGYSPPAPLTVAPGQLLTIFAAGVGKGITQRVSASVLPLPTTLAGISVAWSQYGPLLDQPSLVPLLAVFPVETCAGRQSYPCSTLIGITLQVPYDLSVNIPGTTGITVWAHLNVSDGITTTGATDLFGVEPHAHIVHFGDTVLPGEAFPPEIFGPLAGHPIVSHPDGSLVSMNAPAKIGENLTMFVIGLGRTAPAVKAGDAAPSPPAQTFAEFVLAFDYGRATRPDTYIPLYPALPPHTITMGPTQLSAPLPGWLVPGLAGVYQVNFRVPPPPPSVPNCGSGLLSNLTISFLYSAEAAAICVDTIAAGAVTPSAERPSDRKDDAVIGAQRRAIQAVFGQLFPAIKPRRLP